MPGRPPTSFAAGSTALISVCVIGLGYVGLPTAAVLADAGHQVVGVDIDADVREALSRGQVRIQEPGLAELVARVVSAGRLRVAATPSVADAFVLAVPTPLGGGSRRKPDLDAVIAATDALAPNLRPDALVVVESTSPPGTTVGVIGPRLEERTGLRAGSDFRLAYCPERVLPGNALAELRSNDRVIGGVDVASADAASALYRSFCRGRLYPTDATTAELVKLMENTTRDVNIALANEYARVAERLGIDVWRAIELANHHPRIHILRPGPGVGGHCIAVDPWFLIDAVPDATPLTRAARTRNDAMPGHVVELIRSALGSLESRRVLLLGMTYKSEVDDTRESPSSAVAEILENNGVEVRRHDPFVAAGPLEPLARGADCIVLLVDHAAYGALDPAVLAPCMRTRIAVDTRNALSLPRWTEAGFGVVRLGDGRRHAPVGEGQPA